MIASVKRPVIKTCLLIALTLIGIIVAGRPLVVHAAPLIPVIGVWSTACGSFNITLASCSAISLAAGQQISVQINVTNSQPYNGFETALYYDPGFLNATLVDLKGSGPTTTVWSNPLSLVSSTTAQSGAVFLSVVNLRNTPITVDGILADINFTVKASGVSPLTLAAGMTQPGGGAASQNDVKVDWTRLVLGSTTYDTAKADGYFMNQAAKRGPVAIFSFSPSQPQAGTNVVFNATESYDLDNPTLRSSGITHYYWDFGDAASAPDSPYVHHNFSPTVGPGYVGNFSVRLTVVDGDDGFQGMSTQRILVVPPPLHDVAIQGLTASPTSVNPGGKVSISVRILNKGTYTENFNLTVTYGTPAVNVGFNQSSIAPADTTSYTYTIDTTGLASGSYQVTGVLKIPVANVTSDETGSVTFTVNRPAGSSPLLYIGLGAVAVIAILVITVLLLRRRRHTEEP